MDVIEIARETRSALAAAPPAGRTARLAEIARERGLSVPAMRRVLEGAEFLDRLARLDPDLSEQASALSPPLLSALRAALARDADAALSSLRDHFSGRRPLRMRAALAMGARERPPVPASARAASSAVAAEAGQAIARAFAAGMGLKATLFPAHEAAAPRPVSLLLEAHPVHRFPEFLRPYPYDSDLARFAGDAREATASAPARFAVLAAPGRVRDEAMRAACRDQHWIALGVARRFDGAVILALEEGRARVQVEALLDEAGAAEPRWFVSHPDFDPQAKLFRDGQAVLFGRTGHAHLVYEFPQGFAMTLLAPDLLLLARARSQDVLSEEEVWEARQDASISVNSRRATKNR